MSITYNEGLVAKWRNLAITNKDDLIVGGTYYRNGDVPFTIKELVSTKEHYKRVGLPCDDESNEPAWVVFGNDPHDAFPLTDHNIGASYNPWMIFKDEIVAKACEETLLITFVRTSWPDDF